MEENRTFVGDCQFHALNDQTTLFIIVRTNEQNEVLYKIF